MLKIEIVVGDCSGAELAATSAYLAILARTKGGAAPERVFAGSTGPVSEMTIKINADASQAIAEIERATAAADGARAAGVNMTVVTAKIDPLDLPDAGEDTMQSTPVRLPPIPPAVNPFAAFQAQAAAQAAAVPNVAPSTAGAAPPPTVLVAPPDFSTAPAASPILSAPPAPPAAAQPAAQTDSVPVDKNGLPWDVRIHSGSRAVVTDGTWRMKRNLDPALQASVEAELRQVMGLPAIGVPGPHPVDPAPSGSVPPVPNVTAGPPSVPTPTAPTVQAAAPETSVGTNAFGDLMDYLIPLLPDRINMATLNKFSNDVGLPQFNMIGNRPDLIPAFRERVASFVG